MHLDLINIIFLIAATLVSLSYFFTDMQPTSSRKCAFSAQSCLFDPQKAPVNQKSRRRKSSSTAALYHPVKIGPVPIWKPVRS